MTMQHENNQSISHSPKEAHHRDASSSEGSKLSLTFWVLSSAFVLFALMIVAPLTRLAGTSFLSSLPTNPFLLAFGAILPADLHLTANTHASQVNTDSIEFLILMAALFLLYSAVALQVWRVQLSHGYKNSLVLIWIVAVLVGGIFVFTPSLLSRDAFVYAGYGRVIIAHHANPYYTPLTAFPHDPLIPFDDWSNAIAAYGPLWLLVCIFSALLSGSAILPYLFFFRLLGLLLHLCNIALINRILRTWGRVPRVVLIGTLLYAWNPLVLLESGLGAHNDIAMVTCILLGILFTLRAEQDAIMHTSSYLAPVVAFTAAILIKFTAVPLLAFYIVLLTFRTLHVSSLSQTGLAWKHALLSLLNASLLAGVLIFVAYTPLWLGHSVQDVLASFAAPPSSRLAFGSILLALQKVAAHQGETNAVLYVFSKHSTWNVIDLIVMLAVFIFGVVWLWRVPATRTMLAISLASLVALLIVTPWFFPWYVVWLVGLAASCISDSMSRIEKALVAATLTFSASALFIYLFRGYPPLGDWIGIVCLTTIGPPLLAFLYFFISLRYNQHDIDSKSHVQW